MKAFLINWTTWPSPWWTASWSVSSAPQEVCEDKGLYLVGVASSHMTALQFRWSRCGINTNPSRGRLCISQCDGVGALGSRPHSWLCQMPQGGVSGSTALFSCRLSLSLILCSFPTTLFQNHVWPEGAHIPCHQARRRAEGPHRRDHQEVRDERLQTGGHEDAPGKKPKIVSHAAAYIYLQGKGFDMSSSHNIPLLILTLCSECIRTYTWCCEWHLRPPMSWLACWSIPDCSITD